MANIQRMRRGKQFILLLFIIFGVIIGQYSNHIKKIEKVEAATSKGDFVLKVANKWDPGELIDLNAPITPPLSDGTKTSKSYADLKWDAVSDLERKGYQLFQSEDAGITWSNRSLNFGKAIKVLNVYPNIAGSDKLKEWMDSLTGPATNLIKVTPVKLDDYNLNPDFYLNDGYDVMMFGTWDDNNGVDISPKAVDATKKFIADGKGVLFGHDTVYRERAGGAKHNWWPAFKDLLGVGHELNMEVSATNNPYNLHYTWFDIVSPYYWKYSTEVKIVNNGYMMKYPYEFANDLELEIPEAHNIELQEKAVGETWLEFIRLSGGKDNTHYEDAKWRSSWYLKTNKNVGMIQTGHSKGDSTPAEMKIIANTLYNLAQVSLDNYAIDTTVKDDQAPNLATAIQKSGGTVDNFDIEIESVDNGKEYQWYVEANTKSAGIKKSTVEKETITSNIEGYFYVIDDMSTSTLNTSVETYKNKFGRIPPNKYNLYVAPTGTAEKTDSNYDPAKDESLVTYDTKATISGINGVTDSNKYLHIVAVDRANNVSKVKTIQIKDLMNQFVVTEEYKYRDATGNLQNLGVPNTTTMVNRGNTYLKQGPIQANNWEVSSYMIDGGAEANSSTALITNVTNHHTVTFIYKKAIATANIRQVILKASDFVVVPETGYVDLKHHDTLLNTKVASGVSDTLAFEPIGLELLTGYYIYHLQPVIPEHYQYKGYTLTDTIHTTGTIVDDGTFPALDFTVKGTYWVTIYLEPTTNQPKPYSWDYNKETKIGEIN